MATVRMPSSRHAEMIRRAISPRLAMRIFRNMGSGGPAASGREPDREELLAVLDGLAVARVHGEDLALDVRLDLVHQLHRLDDAEDLALRDALADLRERIRLGRRRTIERSDDRRRDHVDVRLRLRLLLGRSRDGTRSGGKGGGAASRLRRGRNRGDDRDLRARGAVPVDAQAETRALDLEAAEPAVGDEVDELANLFQREHGLQELLLERDRGFVQL